MTKVKPLGDRVLLEIVSPEEKSKGGIFIPIQYQAKTQQGRVVELSDDIDSFKEGDKVIYDVHCGTPIKLNEKDYILVVEEDILCTVEEVEEKI
jgi:chaperonin GroES